MLSFLARSQINFQLKGTCPTPKTPSTRLDLGSTRYIDYNTAMHYNSEKEHVHIFGANRVLEELNCITLSLTNISSNLIDLRDCDYYHGRLHWTEQQNYNLSLTNVDPNSQCQNQTTDIEKLSVWGDENRDILIFWSCTNDTKLTSHKQGIVVFVNSLLVTPDWKGNMDMRVFTRLRKFAEKMLNFTGLNVDDFDVNERLKNDTTCDIFNCTNNCPVSVDEDKGMSIAAPMIFIIVIGFCVIIICLVLL